MVAVLAVLGALAAGGGMMFGIPPIQRSLSYRMNHFHPNAVPDPESLLELMIRGKLSEGDLKHYMKFYGYEADWTEKLIELHHQYLALSEGIELYRRGEIDENTLIENLKKQGFTEDDAKHLVKLSEQLLGAGDLVELLYREKITEDDYYKEMAKLGFPKEKADYVKELYKFMPSPEDFIRFAVRDVFREDRVKKYKLDEDFPQEVVKYAKMRGMDEETLKWYWRAHWELPSPEEVMRMVNILQPDVINAKTANGQRYGDKYRDFGIDPDKIITTYDDLSDYLAMADISPYWRDRFKALTFPPIDRVDLRRLYNLGLIDEGELKARLLELGYSKLDADRLVQFFKAYKLEHEKDLTKSEILRLYSLRAIKKEDAKKMLINMGYDENEADYLLQLQDYQYTQKDIEEKIKTLQILYIKGLLDDNNFIAEMSKYGLPSEQMDVYYDEAVRKKTQAAKMPSKEDLLKMLQSGVLKVEEFKEWMKRAGYSDFWVDKYLKLVGVNS